MPLGKEVGLGPDHIVLDGDPVGTHRPPTAALYTFWPMSTVAGRQSQQLLSSCTICKRSSSPELTLKDIQLTLSVARSL